MCILLHPHPSAHQTASGCRCSRRPAGGGCTAANWSPCTTWWSSMGSQWHGSGCTCPAQRWQWGFSLVWCWQALEGHIGETTLLKWFWGGGGCINDSCAALCVFSRHHKVYMPWFILIVRNKNITNIYLGVLDCLTKISLNSLKERLPSNAVFLQHGFLPCQNQGLILRWIRERVFPSIWACSEYYPLLPPLRWWLWLPLTSIRVECSLSPLMKLLSKPLLTLPAFALTCEKPTE